MKIYLFNLLCLLHKQNKIQVLFYPIIKILRHKKDRSYSYRLQDEDVVIQTPTREELLRIPALIFLVEVENLLKSINENNGTFGVPQIEVFINSIYCHSKKLKSSDKTDIRIILHDHRTKISSELGHSIKTQLGVDSTLLNASGDNTNFIFEVTGNMDDEKMEHFNNIFKTTVRKGEMCFDVATADRMQYLHQIGSNIQFVGTAKNEARTNLVKCGGMEMPAIVGGMLKKFYYENLSGLTSVEDCIDYLAENDIAGYGFDDLKNTYRGKIAHFLLCTFTGMRLGSPWNGSQEVNGGYIVVKNNGDVVTFHSTIADEFKDFLVAKMRMESPSHSRHKDMVIYKEGDRYFLKLALQLRFTLSR